LVLCCSSCLFLAAISSSVAGADPARPGLEGDSSSPFTSSPLRRAISLSLAASWALNEAINSSFSFSCMDFSVWTWTSNSFRIVPTSSSFKDSGNDSAPPPISIVAIC
ncbi:hypothetical protein JQM83_15120, partial [Parabacteroides distasonis]|nr:hypothetical protein [Parabacteroides distasonis]